MKLTVESGRAGEKMTELLALGLFEGGEPLTGAAKDLDEALMGGIGEVRRGNDFPGKLNQTLVLYSNGKIKARRLLLVGLGKRGEFNPETARLTSGKVALQARELAVPSYSVVLIGEGTGLPAEGLAQAVAEGATLALYSYSQFKSDKANLPKEVSEAVILVSDPSTVEEARRGVEVAGVVCEAVKTARDLANAPANLGTPTFLAERAGEISAKHRIKLKILERADMERLGMGGILGVSSGSHQPPKLIVLEYHGAPGGEAPIVLVGKGITFDSGGISIKPSEKMEEMKYDKSGGATVIAVLKAVAELKLPLNVVGLVPATENLPGGSAYRPGDVLKFYGGKTAEIVNTDAEGRLILADALAYAATYKPRAIIDLATLTGACVVALGTHATGLITNNVELGSRVKGVGEATGERVWELPLWKDYHEQIKSTVADMKNVGGRGGGAITAAAFLSNFVGEYPWVHLDIAGTAYTQEGSSDKTYLPKGATGVGVRLLTHLLREWS